MSAPLIFTDKSLCFILVEVLLLEGTHLHYFRVNFLLVLFGTFWSYNSQQISQIITLFNSILKNVLSLCHVWLCDFG